MYINEKIFITLLLLNKLIYLLFHCLIKFIYIYFSLNRIVYNLKLKDELFFGIKTDYLSSKLTIPGFRNKSATNKEYKNFHLK